MAEKDGDGPSLELPSLGLGRKRGRKAKAAQGDAGPGESAPPAAPPPPVAETAERPTEPLSPVTPPPPAGKPLFADEAATTRVGEHPAPAGSRVESPGRSAKPERDRPLLGVGPRTAAAVTGVLVGVLTVGATWGSLRLCEVLRGTSSCGNPGFLLLLAIGIVMVVIGSMLLRAWRVPDPGGTSFLGFGLLTVLALLFLVDVLFAWWMILLIPGLAMLTYLAAQWVATAIVDLED